MIPHRFPFELVRGGAPTAEGVEIRVSGGDWASRGAAIPRLLTLEMLAQASILLLRDHEDSLRDVPEIARDVRLGGVQEASFHGSPRPGDVLVARAHLVGRFGKTLKVTGTLDRDGAAVLEASLLLIL